MTLDEAIEHCKDVAETMLEIGIDQKCIQCGKEHLQLAVWLKELKDRREQENERRK